MNLLDALSSILILLFNIFGVVLAVTFIIVVASHRPCHTTTIFLVLNSVVAAFISNTICGVQAIYQLAGDANDYLCAARGYLLCTATGLLYHTLCVQALHRLFATVLVTRRNLRSGKVIALIVLIQWVVSSCFTLPIFVDGRITYNPGSHICLVRIVICLFEILLDNRTGCVLPL